MTLCFIVLICMLLKTLIKFRTRQRIFGTFLVLWRKIKWFQCPCAKNHLNFIVLPERRNFHFLLILFYTITWSLKIFLSDFFLSSPIFAWNSWLSAHLTEKATKIIPYLSNRMNIYIEKYIAKPIITLGVYYSWDAFFHLCQSTKNGIQIKCWNLYEQIREEIWIP